jgi:hypothetical protein
MDVPFVGRDGELRILADRLGRARAGRSQVVVVEGDPGTGKTALVEAFLARVEVGADVGAVLRANGEEAEELVSYGIVEQLVRAAAGTGGRSGPVVDLHPAGEPPVVGGALVTLLDAMRSPAGPVVVVVDDAHWADARSVQALVFALRRLGADRVLTLVAARPHDGGRIARVRALATAERGTVLRLGGRWAPGCCRSRPRSGCSRTPAGWRCTCGRCSRRSTPRSCGRWTCRCPPRSPTPCW